MNTRAKLFNGLCALSLFVVPVTLSACAAETEQSEAVEHEQSADVASDAVTPCAVVRPQTAVYTDTYSQSTGLARGPWAGFCGLGPTSTGVDTTVLAIQYLQDNVPFDLATQCLAYCGGATCHPTVTAVQNTTEGISGVLIEELESAYGPNNFVVPLDDVATCYDINWEGNPDDLYFNAHRWLGICTCSAT